MDMLPGFLLTLSVSVCIFWWGVEQLVSPGAWLSDMSQERYEVKEKQSFKKVNVNLLNMQILGVSFHLNIFQICPWQIV